MATTTNFGWETPDDTDLVKDGALAIRTLGSAIDTSLVDLKGGTTGQVLSKTSNTDMDFTWVTSDDANAIQNAIVDAKGDLIAASAADTPARLAVGNNGETLVADSSTSTGLRYNPPVGSLANPVINGGFDIWQRGTSQAITNGSINFYGADRWQNYRAAAGSTISRQNVSDSTNLPNIQYAARIQRDSGNTSTAVISIAQAFETVNSIPFAGKSVTFSYYGRAGANYSAASSNLRVRIGTGTGTDQNFMIYGYTGEVLQIDTNNVLTTTWQRFVHTFTVPTNATEIGFIFSTTPVGTAGANDWFEITGVQIDVGTWTATTAPTFRRSGGTLAGELAACQRYFEVVKNDTVSGVFYSTTAAYCIAKFNVPKRIGPTMTYPSTLTNGLYEIATAFRTPSALANEAQGTDQIGFTATGMSSGTIGKSLRGTFGVEITASAEL